MTTELTRKLYTLVLVRKDGKVLLGLKKRGFGEGRWNGFGGKVEPNESIAEGAKRELEEESNLVANQIKQRGIIWFTFEECDLLMEVHVFEVDDFSGEPIESEEMKPQWFNESDIPYQEMWSDDKYWLPTMLTKPLALRAQFSFSKDQKTVLKHEMEWLSEDDLSSFSWEHQTVLYPN